MTVCLCNQNACSTCDVMCTKAGRTRAFEVQGGGGGGGG